MILESTFIGESSADYEHGKRYTLILPYKGSMSIKKYDGTGLVKYSSLSAFFSNWDNIKKHIW